MNSGAKIWVPGVASMVSARHQSFIRTEFCSMLHRPITNFRQGSNLAKASFMRLRRKVVSWFGKHLVVPPLPAIAFLLFTREKTEMRLSAPTLSTECIASIQKPEKKIGPSRPLINELFHLLYSPVATFLVQPVQAEGAIMSPLSNPEPNPRSALN